MIFNQDDFGKGTDSSRSELKSAEETVAEIPAEPEEKTDKHDDNEQPEI